MVIKNIFIIICLISSFNIWAAKIGDIDSTTGPGTVSNKTYVVKVKQYENGTIKEFMMKNGQVFGIVWKGTSNLKVNQYLNASGLVRLQDALNQYKTQHLSNRKFVKDTKHLSSGTFHFISWGKMGHQEGVVFDTSLLPIGFVLKEMKM